MRRRALAFLALFCACNTAGSSRVEPPTRSTDSRVCQPAAACVDLVVAIDTSPSFTDPIGQPLVLSFARSKREVGPDSKLWAAIDGLQGALADLDSDHVAVAVTRLDGGRGGSSRVEAGLSNDYPAVGAVLKRMRELDPRDPSCHGCAARAAVSLLAAGTAAGRCPQLLILADTDVTAPFGPESRSKNENDFAQAIFPLSIARPTLIALGPIEPDDADRLTQALAIAGGRIVTANDVGAVTSAIVNAVESCE